MQLRKILKDIAWFVMFIIVVISMRALLTSYPLMGYAICAIGIIVWFIQENKEKKNDN